MISRIEVLNYRCLRYIDQSVANFHVLVGPNASGKTTFLDVVSFISDLLSSDLEAAINERTSNFNDLLWRGRGDSFSLAVEVITPQELVELLSASNFKRLRYEITICQEDIVQPPKITNERLLLLGDTMEGNTSQPRLDFPEQQLIPDTIMTRKGTTGTKTLVSKGAGSTDKFYPETGVKGSGWIPSFNFGPYRTALANVPDDQDKFPVSTWFKQLIETGVQELVLNSRNLRKASPPGRGTAFNMDGSNLPWVINELKKTETKYSAWLKHIQTILQDVEDIFVVERSDDKHMYLVIRYAGGYDVPSWLVSDGTLRLLALTLPAYIPDFEGVVLIEEPENGVHPYAIEAMMQSLRSVYSAQVLIATHSPVIVGCTDLDELLCFGKTEDGSTDIVLGNMHPKLKQWVHSVNLSDLYVGGVLS